MLEEVYTSSIVKFVRTYKHTQIFGSLYVQCNAMLVAIFHFLGGRICIMELNKPNLNSY